MVVKQDQKEGVIIHTSVEEQEHYDDVWDPEIPDALWKPPKEVIEALKRGKRIEDKIVDKYWEIHGKPLKSRTFARKEAIWGTVDKEALAEGRAICDRIDARKRRKL